MNRLEYLQRTLPQNLSDNQEYSNLEIVVLDYNSTDGLEEYIENCHSADLNSGRLVYYKITSVEFYNWSHSRNLAAKKATGDIICSVDADNFTGSGFATYVNMIFSQNFLSYMTTCDVKLDRSDLLGRICLTRQHFMAVGGYDERMMHYGFEDIDLINRLEMYGLRKHNITDPKFLQAIKHTDEIRLTNSRDRNMLSELYIKHLTPATSELAFILKDGTYRVGTMVNNFLYNSLHLHHGDSEISNRFEYSVLEGSWSEHIWSSQDLVQKFDTQGFQKILNTKLIEDALFFFHQTSNRTFMEENERNYTVRVNLEGFGNGQVIKNFNSIA